MQATPLPLSIRDTLRGRRLLVTGVTGFLGKVWLVALLDALPEIGHVTVLVRGNGHSARERFERIVERSPAFRPLHRRHGPNLSSFLRARVSVVDGDVRRPRCGLHPRDLNRIRTTTDAVLHFAGTTDFDPDPTDAVAINVRGVLNVADVAGRLAVPRLLHVSTCYVAGNVSGEIPEALEPRTAPNGAPLDPMAELEALEADLVAAGTGLADKPARVAAARDRAERLGFPNIYTYTKSLAERLLAERDDVQPTVLRPSIVECARSFPFQGWNEGVNTSAPLSWLIATPFRDFPSTEHHHFDIVPVDLVARGTTLVLAAALLGRAGGVFHLATSDHNPTTFGRIIELNGLATRLRVRRDPNATVWDRVAAHLDPIGVDADRKGLLHVSRLRAWARSAKRALEKIDADPLPEPVGSPVRDGLRDAIKTLGRASRELGRIDAMLEQYRPFTHDNDYVFRTDRVRALSDALGESERDAFRWDAETIDWRHYWVEVEVPGLNTWSIPLLHGESAPQDPPCDPPIRLEATEADPLSATA